MRMWGQVGGGRASGDEDPLAPAGTPVPASRYGGVDRWSDCGMGIEALERHTLRGQRPCKVCLEGARRREQERREAATGLPLVQEELQRQLAELNGSKSTGGRTYRRGNAECGTDSAKRRHRRYGESCLACGIRDGRSIDRPNPWGQRRRDGAMTS